MQTPQRIDNIKFKSKMGRLKYMRKFYKNKLEVCEERQRQLFEELISALDYAMSVMSEAKRLSDAEFGVEPEDVGNRISGLPEAVSTNDDVDVASKTSREELEELAS